MATTREEVLIRLGMDSKALQSGMQQMGSKLKSWAGSVSAHLLAAFAFHKILSQIENLTSSIEKMTLRAEALGINVQFMQDIENVGLLAGSSQEKVEKMMSLFAKGLSPGQDVNVEFRKIIDTINATSDPMARVQIATDAVGKSFTLLLNIAKGGTKEFDRLSSGMQKFSEEQIRVALEVDHAIDRTKNYATHKMGDLLNGAYQTARALRALFNSTTEPFNLGEVISSEMNLARISDQIDAKMAKRAEEKIAKQKELLEYLKLEVAARAEIGRKIDASNLSQVAAKAALAAGVRGLSDTPFAEGAAQTGFENTPHRFSPKQLSDINLAQMMDWQSKQQRIDGNFKEADRLQNERLKVLQKLGFLSPDEQNPLAALQKEMAVANKFAYQMFQMAQNEGMAVKLVAIP